MQPLYPNAQLLQIKPKEKLSYLLNELEQDFKGFYGVDRLLQRAQSLLNDEQDVQIDEIKNCIDEMTNFKKLNFPIKEKLNRINYLIKCNNACFKSEDEHTKSELDVFKNQLEQLKNNGFQNLTNNENLFAELDLICVNQIEELFKKIKETYSERALSSCYETYFQNQISSIQIIEGDQQTKAHYLFQQLFWLMNFLNQFESSYMQFNELENKFKSDRNKYLELCKNLIQSETIQNRKTSIDQQLEILEKEFSDFDPILNYHERLDLGLIQLSTKLNELSTINQVELSSQQEQYTKLIDLLKKTKTNFAIHAKKLQSNFLWAQSCKHKYEVIENIQQKMDTLLEASGNQDHVSLNKEIITDLQQTINQAKTILSEYRGIPLLRCFATLWGGGKVTSQLLVETLEEQVAELQTNINRLPLGV